MEYLVSYSRVRVERVERAYYVAEYVLVIGTYSQPYH
jgi:hypothetical protein